MEAWARPVGNLSPRAANVRVRYGLFALSLALAVAVALAKVEVRFEWRVLLFLPFFFAASGFYQGLYRT